MRFQQKQLLKRIGVYKKEGLLFHIKTGNVESMAHMNIHSCSCTDGVARLHHLYNQSVVCKGYWNDVGCFIKLFNDLFNRTVNRQLVAIAKALSRNVKFLIMDEPTAPLGENEVETLLQLVRELKNQGVTIVYVSHRLDEVFQISDRVSVFRNGKWVKTMNTCDTDKDELIRLMVGRELGATY